MGKEVSLGQEAADKKRWTPSLFDWKERYIVRLLRQNKSLGVR
jgi:hypothetical protein